KGREARDQNLIIHETTASYTSQQNGATERKNKALKEMVNSMLSYSGLSEGFWGEAILTACYLLNRVPNKKNKTIPYKLWREVAKDLVKMKDYRRLSNELRNGVEMRDGCVNKLQIYDTSNEVLVSIEILRRMQLDDMEKVSRLLLMAREIQNKVYEKNTFIAKLRV
nr:zinc finger, CCHC-type [Tanacetum cinerariifolium]